MTGALYIPVDQTAEQALAGVVVASEQGWRLAEGRGVAPEDLYVPLHRRLFEVAPRLAHLSGIDEDSLAERIRLAADLANVPLSEVQRLVDDRPVQRDKSGALAIRVKRAAEARRAMSWCQTVFQRLGEGERVDVVVADMGPGPAVSCGFGRSA